MAGTQKYFLHRELSHGHSDSELATCGLPAGGRCFAYRTGCTQDVSPVWQEDVNNPGKKLFRPRDGGLTDNQAKDTLARHRPVCNTESRDGILTSRSIAEIHGISRKAVCDIWSTRTRCPATMALQIQDDKIQNSKPKFLKAVENSTCRESIAGPIRAEGVVDSIGSKRRRPQHQRSPMPASSSGELAAECSSGHDQRNRPPEQKPGGVAMSPHPHPDSDEEQEEDDEDEESEYALRRHFPFFLRY
jgi:hypothetical protein